MSIRTILKLIDAISDVKMTAIDGVLHIIGRAAAKDLLQERAEAYWGHLHTKHPEWFNEIDGTFEVPVEMQNEVGMCASGHALRCAAGHKRCPHKL